MCLCRWEGGGVVGLGESMGVVSLLTWKGGIWWGEGREIELG